MRKEVEEMELENVLDESFLSEVSAQLRQAEDDQDKPGLVAILQKFLQLYSACLRSMRSYDSKDGVVDNAEQQLEQILDADEDERNDLLKIGLIYGGGERSYQERVLAEVYQRDTDTI